MTTDDAKVFLKYVTHHSPGYDCTDENPANARTLAGKKGAPVCMRCALVMASKSDEAAAILVFKGVVATLPEIAALTATEQAAARVQEILRIGEQARAKAVARRIAAGLPAELPKDDTIDQIFASIAASHKAPWPDRFGGQS